MQLLHSSAAFIETPINRRSHCQCPSNDRADPCEEARERPRARFAIYDLHGRYVLITLSQLLRVRSGRIPWLRAFSLRMRRKPPGCHHEHEGAPCALQLHRCRRTDFSCGR